MNKIVLIENMSEIAAGTRGASLGLGALQVASRNMNSDYFSRFDMVCIEHENHLLDGPTEFKYAKRIDGLVKVYNRSVKQVSAQLIQNNFPLCISGDHACAGGTIAGIKKAFPNKRLGVVWIDAHADLHTPYTTPSGNLHGMPLASALNVNNIECQINEPIEATKKFWNQLKSAGDIEPKILPEDLVFIGVRDTEEPEDKLIERFNIRNFTIEEVKEKGETKILEEIDTYLASCDILYISFDVDSMDCDLVSRGTGTPVPNGLTAEQAQHFVCALGSHKKTVCLEFVEINPCLDDKINTMAETSFKILEAVTNEIEKHLTNEH